MQNIVNNVYLCRMNLSINHQKAGITVRLALVTLMFSLASATASAQQVTISNNLLYDAALTPNLRLGLRLSPHWSLGMTVGYRPWPTSDDVDRKWKHLLVSPSIRYWKDSVNVHHFFGANILYAHYNLAAIHLPFGMYKALRHERRQGDFIGLGAFYGYSWPLGRRWNLEALIGAVFGYSKYNRYECGHCGQLLGRNHKWTVLPQAAINIVFNIPGRPERAKIVEDVVELPAAEPAPFVPLVRKVADNTGRAGQLQQQNSVLQHISQYKPYDRTRILRRDKDALYVHFTAGKADLNGDFRTNASVMDRIVDITHQVMADTTSSVKKIQIVGLASIDGPIAGNETLATQRANVLQSYVQQQVAVPDSLFETVGGGEAWADFRDQLSELSTTDEAQAAQLRQALEVIDGESDANVKESKLRKLNNGKTWAYIKEHILADQRNSGYIRIYYDYVPDTNAKVINEASELLTTDCGDCHQEALRLLQGVRDDQRAQNALGVALWLTGSQAEAMDCFRRAAADGNADAAENLRQLEKSMKK